MIMFTSGSRGVVCKSWGLRKMVQFDTFVRFYVVSYMHNCYSFT
jgi:hypothetical protein